MSVLQQKSNKIALHIEKVEKKKKEHEDELLKEKMLIFEKSLEKQKKMNENREFREQSVKQLPYSTLSSPP